MICKGRIDINTIAHMKNLNSRTLKLDYSIAQLALTELHMWKKYFYCILGVFFHYPCLRKSISPDTTSTFAVLSSLGWKEIKAILRGRKQIALQCTYKKEGQWSALGFGWRSSVPSWDAGCQCHLVQDTSSLCESGVCFRSEESIRLGAEGTLIPVQRGASEWNKTLHSSYGTQNVLKS